MSKVIKVEETIYNALEKQKQGRQTFSDVISGLLSNRLEILEMMNVLEGQIGFRDWQRQKLEQLQKKEEER